MKAVTAETMRELDRRTIAEFGIPGEVLMKRAGFGVAKAALRLAERCPGEPLVQLFAGKGNNGGDAFAAALYIHEAGCAVEVLFAGDSDQVSGDALACLREMLDAGIELRELRGEDEWRKLQSMPQMAGDVLVDGLLGTGISGAARGVVAAAVEVINSFGENTQVLAIDIPSGMNADSGEAPGSVVVADVTLTMGLPKLGLLQPCALDYVGNLEVVDIGIPAALVESVVSDIEFIAADEVRKSFRRRGRVSHKGSYGHVLLVGGAPGYAGAIGLSAMSALRSGAGLVSVLTPESVAAIVAGMVPEAMVHAANVNSTGSLASDVLGAWGHDLSGFDAILVGPGMTQHPDGIDVLRQVVDKSECTLVLDADALNLLAQNPDLVKGAAGRVILTPHPGEMARLLGTGTESSAVQENRFSAVYDVAQKFNAVGVLKGAGTLVCEPGGISRVNMTGNPGMACGGMGDALAGLIVGLSAQGRSPFEAAVAGVYIHGMAGDMAVMNGSQVSLTARDLIDAIPMALRELTGR